MIAELSLTVSGRRCDIAESEQKRTPRFRCRTSEHIAESLVVAGILATRGRIANYLPEIGLFAQISRANGGIFQLTDRRAIGRRLRKNRTLELPGSVKTVRIGVRNALIASSHEFGTSDAARPFCLGRHSVTRGAPVGYTRE